ncbi:SDR family oxidoreductase [uncultured Phascolarctobacterium sp.]|uniref:SDR family oxidoreductase n=1 Tax=Phascolarctobacterium sp. TaxID=2049039 RepID=UPI0025DDABCB|nr:SDR family oxidoreductase [uncultured Phascolarctobacterium sp.]
MVFDLSHKKYLVVGASSGIGREIAISISKLNGKVVLTGRNEDRLKETLSMMSGCGHAIVPYDMNDVLGIKKFVKECIYKIGGKFDGLIFSAGTGRCIPIKSENVERLKEFYNVSYFSYVTLLKEFSSSQVLLDGGSIVAISSRAALFPEKGYLGYGTAKTAINFASRVAAQELSKKKIRVNTVCPEMVKTPMADCFFDVIDKEKLEKFYPLGFLEPEDVADLVIFLLSDMSKKITGQNLYLSAGNAGTPIDGYII